MNCVIRNNYVKFGDEKLISDVLKYLKDHVKEESDLFYSFRK